VLVCEPAPKTESAPAAAVSEVKDFAAAAAPEVAEAAAAAASAAAVHQARLLGGLRAPVRALAVVTSPPEAGAGADGSQWLLVGNNSQELSVSRLPVAAAAAAAGAAAAPVRRYPEFHLGSIFSLAHWQVQASAADDDGGAPAAVAALGAVPPGSAVLPVPPASAGPAPFLSSSSTGGCVGLLACSSNHPVVKVSAVREGAGGEPEFCEQANLLGHTGTVRAVAFQPRSRALLYSAGAGDNGVRLWDLNRARFAPAAAVKAATATGKPASLTAADKACLGVFRGHTAPVFDVSAAEACPALLATAGADGYGYLWDCRTGYAPVWSTPQQSPLSSVALTGAGGRLYTGHADGSVCAWDTRVSYAAPWYGLAAPLAAAATAGAVSAAAPVADAGEYLSWRSEFGALDIRSLQTLQALSTAAGTAVLAAAFSGDVVTLDGATGAVTRRWFPPPTSAGARTAAAAAAAEKWTCVRAVAAPNSSAEPVFVAASALKAVHMFWTEPVE
jgi:hypothetical protein